MPIFTRPQKKQILAHVLTEMQDNKDDGTPGPIGRVIVAEKITDILDIISYSDTDFLGLQYQKTPAERFKHFHGPKAIDSSY